MASEKFPGARFLQIPLETMLLPTLILANLTDQIGILLVGGGGVGHAPSENFEIWKSFCA